MTGFDSKRKAALDEEGMYLVHQTAQPEQDATMQSLKDLARSVCDEVGKAAFAQPAQKPDVVMHWASHTWTTLNPPPKGSDNVNLYYAPAAQRTWVGLTDEEIWDAYMKAPLTLDCSTDELYALSRTIEAKLKEKNNAT